MKIEEAVRIVNHPYSLSYPSDKRYEVIEKIMESQAILRMGKQETVKLLEFMWTYIKENQ